MPKERRYLLWVPLVDHCGGPHEKMLYPVKTKDLSLWTWKQNYVKRAHHLPLYGRGFQPFLAVRYQDCRSFVSGEGRPCTPMGIRGALSPVGYSDPSLRDSRSQLARLEIHNPGTFIAANVSHPGEAEWYHHS